MYVGLSNDLVRRFAQHQDGKSQTTRAYRPFELVYSEGFISRLAARKREKYLKSGIGKEWVRRILARECSARLPAGRQV